MKAALKNRKKLNATIANNSTTFAASPTNPAMRSQLVTDMSTIHLSQANLKNSPLVKRSKYESTKHSLLTSKKHFVTGNALRFETHQDDEVEVEGEDIYSHKRFQRKDNQASLSQFDQASSVEQDLRNDKESYMMPSHSNAVIRKSNPRIGNRRQSDIVINNVRQFAILQVQ